MVKRTYISSKKNVRVYHEIREKVIDYHLKNPNATDKQIRNKALRSYPLWNISLSEVHNFRKRGESIRKIFKPVSKKERERIKPSEYTLTYETIGFIEYVIEGGSPQIENYYTGKLERIEIYAINDNQAIQKGKKEYRNLVDFLEKETKEFDKYPFSRVIQGSVAISHAEIVKENRILYSFPIKFVFKDKSNGGLLQ